jgi:ATP-binding cassette subfamily B protein RaxB
MECGLACISMLATFYGHPIPLSHLRARFAVGATGVSINGLLKVLEHLGHKGAAIDATLSDLARLGVPAIIHLHPGHFVVLGRQTPTKTEVLDPSQGRLRLPAGALEKRYTGSAIVIFPEEGRLPRSPDYRTFRY